MYPVSAAPSAPEVMVPAPIPAGLCQCGCGQTMKPAARSRDGVRKGEPARFLRGHCGRRSGPASAPRAAPDLALLGLDCAPPPPGLDLPDLVIYEVERRMLVPHGSVRARNRSPRLAEARHAAMWALQRALGLNAMEIARELARNHSTVVYGLARVEARPDWQAAVRPAIELAGAGGPGQALRRWLERGLRGVPAPELRAIYAYGACTLLDLERHPDATCAYGMLLVLGSARARAALEGALRCIDAAEHIARIDWHAARMGRAG